MGPDGGARAPAREIRTTEWAPPNAGAPGDGDAGRRLDTAAGGCGGAHACEPGPARPLLQLADFVGEHGVYQMSLTLLLFVRYVLLGLMANSGPLMTPDVTFYCQLPEREILMIMPNISLLGERERNLELQEEFKQICQIDLHLYRNQSQLALLGNASARAQLAPTLGVGVGVGGASERSRASQIFKTSPISAGKPKPHARPANTSASEAAGAAPVAASAAAATASPGDELERELSDFFANRIRECTDFSYQQTRDQGRTVTSEFDLVCDRDWLRSLFQSMLSAAIVIAHVFWGTFSDKYGRFQAQRICLLVSLLAGLLSIVAWDFWSFTLARALCSFGDLGLVVSLTTVMVELVGSNYRGCSVALVNFGYALGVSLLPYIVAYFEDFRLVIGFTVLCHMVSMPLVLATGESARWLLTNRRFREAKRELRRIARWNRRFCELGADRLKCAGSAGDGGGCGGGGGGSCDHAASNVPGPDKGRRASTREQKRAFELKFAQFVEQIEAQNLCDPVLGLAEPGALPGRGGPALHSACPTPSVQRPVARRQLAPPLAPPLPRPDAQTPDGPGRRHSNWQLPSEGRFSFPPAPDETGSSPDAHAHAQPPQSQPLPRVLARLDLERLELIREVEGKAGAPSERRRSHQSSLLNETLIRSLEMRHEQRLRDTELLRLSKRVDACAVPAGPLSRASSVSGDLGPDCRESGPPERPANAQSGHAHSFSSGIDNNNNNNQGDTENIPSISEWRNHLLRRQQQQQQQQPDCINLVAHQLSFVGRVSRLFKDKRLMVAVFTIVWTTFNSELLYTSFIIINLEVGEDLYLNYVLGGCMEALAAVVASLLLSYSPRRISLIAFWLLISFACFGLSLAHIDSTWAVWMLALAKFSQSSLSSIATVAAYESFPTFLRQSGSGLVFTLGMLGSVFAPLIFAEFDDHAGMDRVLMTFSVSSLTAASLIYLFLNETRNCELM